MRAGHAFVHVPRYNSCRRPGPRAAAYAQRADVAFLRRPPLLLLLRALHLLLRLRHLHLLLLLQLLVLVVVPLLQVVLVHLPRVAAHRLARTKREYEIKLAEQHCGAPTTTKAATRRRPSAPRQRGPPRSMSAATAAALRQRLLPGLRLQRRRRQPRVHRVRRSGRRRLQRGLERLRWLVVVRRRFLFRHRPQLLVRHVLPARSAVSDDLHLLLHIVDRRRPSMSAGST